MAHPEDVARAVEIVRIAFPDEMDSARYKRVLKTYADGGRVVPEATAEIIVLLLTLTHPGHEAETLQRVALSIAKHEGPDTPGQ